MAQLTDVSVSLGKLKAAVVKEIQDVKDKIAKGGVASAADLDAVVTAIDKATADVDTISEGGAVVVPPVGP